MYARLFTVNVQPDKLNEFPNAFSEMILPDICQEQGFKGIYVMQEAVQSKITALVLWETEADALASINGYLRQRLPKMADFLAGPPITETLEVVLRA